MSKSKPARAPHSTRVLLGDVGFGRLLMGGGLWLAGSLIWAIGPKALSAGEWQQTGLDGVTLETVAVDPADDYFLLAGGGPEWGTGIWKSTDGGATWAHASQGLGDIHRVNTIAIEPPDLFEQSTSHFPSATQEPRAILIGVLALDGRSLFRSDDRGESWQESSNGLPSSGEEVTSIVFDPVSPDIVFAGLNGQVGGVFKSVDGGLNWLDASSGLGADGFCMRGCVLDLAIDPSSPTTIYSTMPALGDVYKTTSDGESWFPTGAGLWAERLAMAPSAPATIFTSGSVFDSGGIARTYDGGTTWQNLSHQPGLPPLIDASHRSMAIDPADPDAVWLVTEYFGTWPDTFEVVFRSVDGGFSWSEADEGLEGVRVRGLSFQAGSLLAATDDGIYRRSSSAPTVEGCEENATTMCLRGGRFRVVAEYRDHAGRVGTARVVEGASDNSGLFWFFSADNWEMLVKVLDGCTISGHYWVFSAATTNVEYTLSVTDTETGAVREYSNPLGQAAVAINDTRAFDACP